MQNFLTKIQRRQPDFTNLLKVLRKEIPDRPTLFEFFMNQNLYELLADEKAKNTDDELRKFRVIISAFRNAGYDYATIPASYSNILKFDRAASNQKNSRSLNEGFVITDTESFEKYLWPNAESGNYDIFEILAPMVPEGMKLVPSGPGGVLENAIDLTGYENLCFISMMDETLCRAIFDAIGSRLLAFYERIACYPVVGAMIYNDDWGFKTQTMFPPEMLRTYVFPWCKKITKAVHAHGKPVILHSCGNLSEAMEDVVEDMDFNGKHSFEDIIIPVEEAYQKWGRQIAIMGGIDIDFLTTSTPEIIQKRASSLIRESLSQGGYALGSGNSIPDYIPVENYFAMIGTILSK
ncbi:MAG: uroporphyrinogen decarboxylase family protein [Prolixibacteraceae bacterium]|jgi:uroporphyrinogen decarboxylase|nr:uroporphyrinogen decarboxylase family protein [Prolixibacteraceae bacterium]